MKNLMKVLCNKPKLYEQSDLNMWEDPHISKGMLKAHLDESLDSATRNHNFVEKSVEWISAIAPPRDYPCLLDLGCGPGIYAELFHEKGYRVTGIDISKKSIQYAAKEAKAKNFDIEYILGDYTNILFASKYNIITLIYCDFGVLPTQTRQTLLNRIYNALHHNGTLIFDVFTPLKYDGIEEKNDWDICENGFWDENLCLTLQSFYRYDEDHTFLNRYINVTKEDQISMYHIWDHTFTFNELENDLEQAGFTHIKFFKDVSGKTCSKSDDTICVVAEKT